MTFTAASTQCVSFGATLDAQSATPSSTALKLAATILVVHTFQYSMPSITRLAHNAIVRIMPVCASRAVLTTYALRQKAVVHPKCGIADTSQAGTV
jgi:hypothetical protein